MHSLYRLSIKNFRSCRGCDMPLADYTPIVGYNNGGKSNILQAVSWLLEGGALGATDFFHEEEGVEVEGWIGGIFDGLLNDLAEVHRKKIGPRCVDGVLRIRRVQAEPSGSRKAAKLEVWNPEAEEEDEWGDNPAGIEQAISALFPSPVHISAMQDATEDVAKSKTSTTIGKLISEITTPIRQAHESSLEAALDEIRSLLQAEGEARAPELQDFDAGANEVIAEFFPGVSISLHLPPPEVTELFKSGTIKVFEDGSERARDIEALGHGAQRSIQMALVRYLSEIQRTEGSEGRTLLLIDEPELYLHPQAISIVRSALRRLSRDRFQVVFSTHSPQMVDVADVSDTLIVRKTEDEGTHVLPTVRSAVEAAFEDAKSQANTLFELSNAAQILFADRVILAEGKAEQRLLPVVAERILPGGLSGSNTALVSVGSCYNIPKALAVLSVMGVSAKGLVDLDYAFRGGVRGRFISSTHESVEACRSLFVSLSEEHDIRLENDGFPKKGGTVGTEEAFAILGAHADARDHIASLADVLKSNDVWLWTRGSLEHHLGISGKDEDTWGEYADAVRSGEMKDVVSDLEGVEDFFTWASRPARSD